MYRIDAVNSIIIKTNSNNEKSLCYSFGRFSFYFLYECLGSDKGSDYFAGKWNILVKGLPNGDTKMMVVLDKKDTTLTGTILDSVGTETAKFSKVELKENEVTLYFTAQGYDVYLTMDKKDEDHVTGSMMGMFDAEGTRAKSVK
jgi:hypothetical protein